MSYDVLDVLRRRLVALSGTIRSDPASRGTSSSAPDPAATILADGGDGPDRDDDAHLRDLPDGAGCAEIWEHLSERQAEERRREERQAEERRPEDGRARECQADD